jgi:uncharacterized protein YgiM (DUF1202 family)
MKKKILFLGTLSLVLLSGCTNQSQVQPPKIITKKVIYTPSEDVKKAVAILIYKQKDLENRIKSLEGKKTLTKNKKLKKNRKIVSNCEFKKDAKIEYCSNKFDKNKYYQAILNVNIRRCSTIHSPIVGIIKKGEKVKFLHCNKYCWCFLKNNKGYVNRKFFKILDKTKVEIKENKNNDKKGVINVDKVIKNYINDK